MSETKNGLIEKNTGKCRSCQAEVIWALTAAGKKMPLDAKPVSGFVLDDDLWLDAPTILTTGKIYVSHFATCPNSDQHRRS